MAVPSDLSGLRRASSSVALCIALGSRSGRIQVAFRPPSWPLRRDAPSHVPPLLGINSDDGQGFVGSALESTAMTIHRKI